MVACQRLTGIWLARMMLVGAPHLSAAEILNRLNESSGRTFSEKQVRTVQRHVKAWRRKTARKLMDSAMPAIAPSSFESDH